MTNAAERNGELIAALEVARAQQKQAIGNLVGLSVRTLQLLEKEGISIGPARSSSALMKLGPAALTVADRHPPESRAHRGAQLIGLVSSLLSHWVSREKQDLRSVADIRSHELSFQIGHFAGMLELDLDGFFAVVDKAKRNKMGRARNMLERNLTKIAWHGPALAMAKLQRDQFPKKSTAGIAEFIHSDRTNPTPSAERVGKFLRKCEKDETLPRKKRADKN